MNGSRMLESILVAFSGMYSNCYGRTHLFCCILAFSLFSHAVFGLDEDTLKQPVTNLKFSGGASNIKKWDKNPFVADEHTILLLHFDDDGTIAVKDSSGKNTQFFLRTDPHCRSTNISAWPLADEVGNGAITSFSRGGGSANWVSGRFGMGIWIQDTLAYIPHAGRLLNVKEGTMEAWIFPARNYSGGIVGYGRLGEGPVLYTENIDGKYCVRGFWKGPHYTKPVEVPLNKWTHVAMIWNGPKIMLYVNGREVDVIEVAPEKRDVKPDLPCMVGHSWPVVRKGRGFFGIIDEVRVSDIARKPNELMWFEGDFDYAVKARMADRKAWEQAFQIIDGLNNLSTKKLSSHEVPEGFKILGNKGREQTGIADNGPQLGDVSSSEASIQVHDAGANIMPKLPKSDTDSGYIIFSAHYAKEVYMNTIPKSEQLKPKLKLFASRGEYEPVTFSVKAIDPLEVSAVKIGDFVNNHGDVIGKENVDVRSVRYFKIKYGKKHLFKPKLLEKRWPLKLIKDQTQRFWLTVRVPDKAAPGLYVSHIKVSVKGRPAREIPVMLKVLPFKLAKSRIDYGTFFLGDPLTHPESSKWVYPKNLKKIFINYREHGLNTIFMFEMNPVLTWNHGQIKIDASETEMIMDAYQAAGLNGPVVGIDLRNIIRWCIGLDKKKYSVFSPSRSEGFQAGKRSINALRSIVKQILEIAAKKKWPEVYFAPGEELRSSNTRMSFLYWSQFLVDIPGVKIALISDGTLLGLDRCRQYDEWIDMRLPLNLTPKAIEDAKKSSDLNWLYNQGWTRMIWGYHLLKTEVTGYLQWADQWHRTDPYGELTSRSMSWGYTYPAPDGPIPTLKSERSREGIDDVRYVRTLEALIAKASSSSDSAVRYKADHARKTIKFILDQIGYGRNILGLHSSQTDPHDLDVLRWRVAMDIMKLREALNKN